MSNFEDLGVDPLFPNGGTAYKVGDVYLNEIHGGKSAHEWLEKNFEAKPDDVYVVSYAKTGTTWAQEMAYIIGNDLDFAKAKSKPIFERFPYLELKLTIEKDLINKLTSPRYIKTHYPYSLLPQSIIDNKCKMIYTIRNPKDTVVSFYHFAVKNNFLSYQGDFETFFNLFIKEERLIYSPFSKHILEFWNRRNQENILILCFEDMKRDMKPSIRQVASFLGKTLTDQQVQEVEKHCSFESMNKNPSTNYTGLVPNFMRKGEVGDWRNYFTDEMNEQMDEFIQRHFAGSGLKFEFD